MMTVKLNVESMSENLLRVKAIKDSSDSMGTAQVCNMYLDLCEQIAKGIVSDDMTGEIVKRMERMDSQDRPHRHSISGHANDPSTMQQLAFEKENDK